MLIRLISLAILFVLMNANHVSFADDKFIFPKDKPSVFKKIEKKTTKGEVFQQNKPIIKSNKVAKEKEKISIIQDKKENAIEKKTEITKKKDIIISTFIIPKKKPKTVKQIASSAKRSKFLNQKDFDRAKIAFDQIKSGKMITGFKTSQKIKDKDFKTFVQ